MKKIQVAFFFLICCLVIMACPVRAAKAVQLGSKSTKCTLYTGTSRTFQLKSAALRKKKAVWSSGKKSVATVSAKGVVKAKKPGKAVITCKVKGKKYKCTVTVKARKMTSLKISQGMMYVGNSSKLTVTIAPQNTYNKKLTYISSNPAVISVSQSGTLVAKSAGSAVITVKSTDGSGKKASCTVLAIEKLKRDSVHFVAHRGLSSAAPENTKKAFELAGQAGFWGAETDVRVTSDGEYILLHDASFQRMCGVDLKPEDMTLEEIKALTVISGNHIDDYKEDADATQICTLKEYLEICKLYNMVPVIELKLACGSNPKYNGTELQDTDDLDESLDFTMQDIDRTVRSIMNTDPYVYIGFSSAVVAEMAKIRSSKNESNMGLQLLTSAQDASSRTNTISFCKTYDMVWNMGDSSLTQGAFQAAKAAGLNVNVWTIDSVSRAEMLAYYGADYITTNKILWQ